MKNLDAENCLLRQFQKRIVSELRRRHLYWWGPNKKMIPHPISLGPLWFSKNLLEPAAVIGRAFRSALIKLPGLALKDSRVESLLHLNEQEKHWFRHFGPLLAGDPDPPIYLRLDCAFPLGGNPHDLKVFEANGTASAGAHNQTEGAKILKQLLRFPGQAQDVALSVLRDLVSYAKPARGAGSIAFVDDLKTRIFSQEIEPLGRRLSKELRVPTCLVDVQELRWDKGTLTGPKGEIGFLWREVEFWEWITIKPAVALESLLLRRMAYPALASDFCFKGFMEFVSSPDYWQHFSRQMVRVFAAHALWSRLVYPRNCWDFEGKKKEDLYRFLLARQEHLLLKPNRGMCGDSIKLGKNLEPRAWRQYVECAMKEPGKWVAQRYHPVSFLSDVPVYRNGIEQFRRAYPTLGIFAFKNNVGLHGRIAPGEIVNVSRGGAVAPVLIA